MGKPRRCCVKGCDRMYVPGVDGAAKGRCSMHYKRLQRAEEEGISPDLVDVAESRVSRERGRLELVQAYVEPDVKQKAVEYAQRRVGFKSLSAWVADAITEKIKREERRANAG